MEEINRDEYKAIKRYNREELEMFIASIYQSAFRDGAEAGIKADFKIKLIPLLEQTKGVGKATKTKILNTLKEMEE